MGISKESLSKLQKAFGKEAVMTLGESMNLDIELLPSGSLLLDHALGGGYPMGRIIEIAGPESSGKTTLAIHAIAEAQGRGKNCAMIDAEHAFDKVYAENLGVNTDDLLISQPDTGEQALDLVEAMIDTGEVQLIVIDSTSSLVPRAELEGEMGDSAVGLQARLLSKALRKVTGKAKKNNCLLIFISQLREKIGVMYGSPEVIGVGNALKFYASQRIVVRKSTQVNGKDGFGPEGNVTKAKVIKNKVAPPFRETEYTIKYGKGIDKEGELIDLAVDFKVIDKSGSWYSYQGTKLGQGKENCLAILNDNPDLLDEIKSIVTEMSNESLKL
jgi:recombination protein RecA